MGQGLGTNAGVIPARKGSFEALTVTRTHAIGAGHQLNAMLIGHAVRLDHIARELVEGRAKVRRAVGIVGVSRLSVVFRRRLGLKDALAARLRRLARRDLVRTGKLLSARRQGHRQVQDIIELKQGVAHFDRASRVVRVSRVARVVHDGHIARVGRRSTTPALSLATRTGFPARNDVAQLVHTKELVPKHLMGGRIAEYAFARAPERELGIRLGVDIEEFKRTRIISIFSSSCTVSARLAKGSVGIVNVHAGPRAGAGGLASDKSIARVDRNAAVLAKRKIDATDEAVGHAAVGKAAIAGYRLLTKELAGNGVGHLGAQLTIGLLGGREAQDHALLGAREGHVEQTSALTCLVLNALLLHEHAPLKRRLALLGAGRRVFAKIGKLKTRRRKGEQLTVTIAHGKQTRRRRLTLGPTAPNNGHDVKLKTLGGVRRHKAHGIQALARKGSRTLLHRVEPARELVCHKGRIQAELVGKLADVAHGGKHVGRDGTALHALVLEPRQPTRLTDGHEADISDGQLAHALPSPAHHVACGHEALGGTNLAKVW